MKLYAVVLFSEVVVVDLLKCICIGERAVFSAHQHLII